MRFVFLLLLSVPLLAIVAIKPREVGENPGMSGSLIGSFETKRGNTDKDNYEGSAKLQYDDNRSSLVWGMLRGEYGQVRGKRNTNNLFAHVRYIYNLYGNNFALEAFAQAEEDEFKSIKNRSLLGGGARWKVVDGSGEWGGVFVGAGAFFEYVAYASEVDPLERNVRFQSYLAYTVGFGDDNRFTTVAYHQPRLNKLDDYLLSVSGGVEVQVYRELFVAFHISYEHDSAPAVGVKKDDFAQRTLFKYKF